MTSLGYKFTDAHHEHCSKAQLGRRHSDETKDKIRMAHLGIPRSALTKEKLRQANRGKKLVGDHRRNFSMAALGRIVSEETRAKLRFKRSAETKAKMSAASMGNTRCRGIKRTPETRAKMSEAKRKQWQNREFKEKVMKASMLGRFIHPNKPEMAVLGLLDAYYPGEWKFVGDGTLIMGGRNPDFANINGRKAIIELFGDYWHRGENPQDRIDLFGTFGFRTLVIWEGELKDLLATLARIDDFVASVPCRNGERGKPC